MPESTKSPFLRDGQLYVHGEPFLARSGELQNSSMTSARYMESVWPKLKANKFNTILGAITWEDIEPEEGNFDFSELEGCIKGARANGLRLVLLWFGSFKNGKSTYVPSWVKKNHKRFPRAHITTVDGLRTTEVLSIFDERNNAQSADMKAFTRLLEKVKDLDSDHSTVIMIQLENEIGLLGDSRDRSKVAEARYNQSVPSDMLDLLRSINLHPSFVEMYAKRNPVSGATWSQVFGDNAHTDELFMAYYYAKYTKPIVQAGKIVYPIPMYSNAWLNYNETTDDSPFPEVAGGGQYPGTYPSGGPVPHVLEVWMAFAGLDFVAPDSYLTNYDKTCESYAYKGQPFFIPEQRRDEYGARRIWRAIGSYGAIGCSPFGIDTVLPSEIWSTTYGILESIAPYVLQAQRNNQSFGFYFDDVDDKRSVKIWKCTFGGLELTITRSFVFGRPGTGAGMIIHLGNMRFLVAGYGFQVQARSLDPQTTFTGIASFNELESLLGDQTHVAGNAINSPGTSSLPGFAIRRRLNGDETRSGSCIMMPNKDPDYGGFPISITIPAETMIASCEFYTLSEESSDM